MKSLIKKELIDNKKYLYLTIFISILSILPQLVNLFSIKYVILLILILMFLVITAKISKILFTIFILYLSVINIAIVHLSLVWGKITNFENKIELLVLSPQSEMLEYIHNYVGYEVLLMVFYNFIIYYLLFIFLLKYSHSFKILKIIAMLFAIFSLISLSIFTNIFKVVPLSIYNDYFNVKERMELLKTRSNYIKKYVQSNIIYNNNLIYNKVILIMGESVNKTHLEIYNNDRNTTPFLSSLNYINKLYIFNTVAPANQTRYAVPLALTSATSIDFFSKFIQSKSIITDFNVFNYKTFWISNQAKTGMNDSYISSIANEADKIEYLHFKYDNIGFDQDVVDKFNMYYKRNNTPQMFLLHLMGSHFEYKKRYPKKHELYKEANTLIKQYDNSIYYTDSIVKNIFNRIGKNEKVLIIFTSDHSEVVSNSKFGHGFNPPFKDEYKIPLLVYSSIKNNRLDNLLKLNNNHIFNNESLIDIIKYITFISNDCNISNSFHVIGSDENNIYNYNELKNYLKDKKDD